MIIEDKTKALSDLLVSLRRVLVAFSGGVDSTYLLYAAIRALGPQKVLAVMAQSPTYPQEEADQALEIARSLGSSYRLIETDEFQDENFIANPANRCYYCKKELFGKLKDLAAESGLDQVIDGSNVDDLSDYRPGSQAKKEYAIRSPLQEVGLNKAEIRELSKAAGLPTWDKPALACLASRIPYGIRITEEILNKIEEGERYLRTLGFKQLRVRHHDAIVRIEVEKEALAKIMHQEVMEKIVRKFEALGYVYVTLDLKGYRTGSMNETGFKLLEDV